MHYSIESMNNCSAIQLLDVASYSLVCKYIKITKETVLLGASTELEKKKKNSWVSKADENVLG